MGISSNKEQQYILAKKRVKKISKFYKHLAIYIVVNLFLSAIFIVGDINDGATFSTAFFKFKTFAIWIYWGVGLVFQGIKIFGASLFFNKNWEERKIKEFINDEN